MNSFIQLIGNYTHCEIIEIFGIENKSSFNIFTLVVFQNGDYREIQEDFLTNGLQKLNNSIKCGIAKRVLTIGEVIEFFELLKNKEKHKFYEKLDIKNLKLLENQYVKADRDTYKKVQLNNVLKNNFFNGSYVFEFFDEKKENVKFLLENVKLLEEFSNEVNKILPINIANISDRLGNIVFQLSINLFKVDISSIVDRSVSNPKFQGFEIDIISNNIINNLELNLYEEYDNVVTLQKSVDIINNRAILNFDDSFGTFIEIFNKKDKILLCKEQVHIMKNMHLEMHIVEHQKRIFKLNNKIEQVEVVNNSTQNIGKDKKVYRDWIAERIYENELSLLEKDRYFVQYWRKTEDRNLPKEERHKKALKDLHYLIDKYGKNGVYLWDPYLSAEDIKKTLYYCRYAYVLLRAITALKAECKYEMKEKFEVDDKDKLFLNLEVRAKVGNYGFNFHDRFIIFPGNYDTKPRVWSLGTSINSFGKEHHILQEVKHAVHILNTFNELWNELNHQECIVWKI